MLFQSTLPRGSDRIAPAGFTRAERFQSTLPRGSDIRQGDFKVPPLKFQSTLPRGSDSAQPYRHGLADYFNPRSLAGATSYNYLKAHGVPISIHAPSRERRGVGGLRGSAPGISIHAPSRERRGVAALLPELRHFNPRSLAGATVNGIGSNPKADISIHAPSRERRNSPASARLGR